MNRGAKRAAKALFDYAGGTSWIRRRFRNAVRILMYHRFPQGSRFEAQCAHLRKFYRPVTLTDAAERLLGDKPISEPMVVVTVDDGYRDFLENAFPILTQYGIPATVFLTTDLPDRESWLWVDQVTYCLRQTRVAEITLFNSGRRWTLDTDERRKEAGLSIKQALKAIPNQERLEWLAKLPGLLKVDLPATPPDSHAPLRWDDVRTLARQGVEFGAHTKTHPILSRLATAEELNAEIGGSQQRIEQETGRAVQHFCYPNGTLADFTQAAVDMVRDSGFTTAVTAIHGVNTVGADPFRLSRMNIDACDEDLSFVLTVAGRGIKQP